VTHSDKHSSLLRVEINYCCKKYYCNPSWSLY